MNATSTNWSHWAVVGNGTMANNEISPGLSVGGGNETVQEYIFDRLSIQILFIFLYTLVFLFCVFGNLLVLLVVSLHWRMRHVTKFCLANLAFADLCVGIFCVYQNLSTHLIESWLLGEFLCKMYQFIIALSHTASILTLLVVCVERYLAILHPLQCRRLLTRSRLRVVMAVVWLSSALYCSPRLYYMMLLRVPREVPDGDEMIEIICTARRTLFDSRLFDIVNSVLLYFIPLFVMTILYFRVGLLLWKSSSSMAPAKIPHPSPTGILADGVSRGNHGGDLEDLKMERTLMRLTQSTLNFPWRRLSLMKSKSEADLMGGFRKAHVQPTRRLRRDHHRKCKISKKPWGKMKERSKPRIIIRSVSLNNVGRESSSSSSGCTASSPPNQLSSARSGISILSKEMDKISSSNFNDGDNRSISCSSRSGCNNTMGGSKVIKIPETRDHTGHIKKYVFIKNKKRKGEEIYCSCSSGSSSCGNYSAGGTHRWVSRRFEGKMNLVQSGGRDELRSRQSVVKMLIVIVGVFALCNLPYHLRKFAIYFHPNFDLGSIWGTLVLPLSHLSMYCNSAINPFIYALMSASFRASVKDLFKCQWRREPYNNRRAPNSSSQQRRRQILDTKIVLTSSRNNDTENNKVSQSRSERICSGC